MEQITLGVNYLHTLPQPVIHGDLKIANVLVGIGCEMKARVVFVTNKWCEELLNTRLSC